MNSAGRLAPRVLPFALPWALCLACGVPVDDSKYQVVREAASPPERVVSAFGKGNDGCEACLLDDCMSDITACVDTPGCTELAQCAEHEADPAGQTRCASRLQDVTIDALAAYGHTRDCWVGCKSACNVGKNWDCVGEYRAPRVTDQDITLRQTFSYACGGEFAGAEAVLCDAEGQCGDWHSTDASGTYSVDLTINDKPIVAGWRGFRRVTGPGLVFPHRLERNLPIWTDQVESTLLMPLTCAVPYLEALEASEPEVDPATLFAVQFFDCQTAGAEGVALELSGAPDAKIFYVTSYGDDFDYERDSSRRTGEGLAIIAGVPLGDHEFVAREVTSGKVIASGRLTVPEGELLIYSVFPQALE